MPKKRLGFTTGVPAPAGAGMAMMPLFWDLANDGALGADPMLKAWITAVVVAVTAFLMVAALPGWGFKAVQVPRTARLFVLAGVGLFAAALAQAPWMTLFAVAATYTLAFPFATLRYRRLRQAELAARLPAEAPDAPAA
jgi:CDP-diacylglycerol--serine O-phosphatidyltransferase